MHLVSIEEPGCECKRGDRGVVTWEGRTKRGWKLTLTLREQTSSQYFKVRGW